MIGRGGVMTDPLELMADLLVAEGRALIDRRTAQRSVDRKGSHSDIVCDADRASEACILEMLAARAPHDAVLSEEAA